LVARSRQYAEAKLGSLWGVDEKQIADRDFCESIKKHDLNCLDATGGVANLEKFNRPAILYLDIADVPAYAVMMKLGQDKVALDVLGQEHLLSTDSLNQVWDGRFRLLWRHPKNVGPYISIGADGNDAAWLRAAIDRVQGTRTTGKVYDHQLAVRVKKFQREAGLRPDGIVGPKTFIALQNKLAALQDKVAKVDG